MPLKHNLFLTDSFFSEIKVHKITYSFKSVEWLSFKNCEIFNYIIGQYHNFFYRCFQFLSSKHVPNNLNAFWLSIKSAPMIWSILNITWLTDDRMLPWNQSTGLATHYNCRQFRDVLFLMHASLVKWGFLYTAMQYILWFI